MTPDQWTHLIERLQSAEAGLSPEAWIALAALALTCVVAVVGAAVTIVRRLGDISAAQKQGATETAEIKSDVAEIKQSLHQGLAGAREGRQALWQEVNPLRERVAVVEARCAIVHRQSAPRPSETDEDMRG